MVSDQAAAAELRRRQIHRNAHAARGPRSCQARACRHASRTTHSPMAPIRPHSSASGMKASGGIKPRCGCTQRMSASALRTAPRVRVHLRLVIELELIQRDRLMQVALELHAILDARAHTPFEALNAAASALLRAIHGGVGVRGQRLRWSLPSCGIQGDADARRGVHVDLRRCAPAPAATSTARIASRLASSACSTECDQQHELIAADARHGIGRAHQARQAARDLLQQLIARAVSRANR